MKAPRVTLDQWRTLQAVVDQGGYAQAAETLHRSQSSVSYAVARLQEQLGMQLLRIDGRKAVLTEAGSVLLRRSRQLVNQASQLEDLAQHLDQGWEAEVRLVVDAAYPNTRLIRALSAFIPQSRGCRVRLREEVLSGVEEVLLGGDADLAIGGPVVIELPDLQRQTIGAVELVPVAAPAHPLAQTGVQPGESRRHLQLVLTDRSALSDGREFSVLSPQTWRLADLGAKHELLRQGIGWGNMPAHMVRGDLASGALTLLDLPEKPGATYPLNALWRRDSRLGPATSWLIDAFRERLAGCPA